MAGVGSAQAIELLNSAGGAHRGATSATRQSRISPKPFAIELALRERKPLDSFVMGVQWERRLSSTSNPLLLAAIEETARHAQHARIPVNHGYVVLWCGCF
jgi:hypothetical protein